MCLITSAVTNLSTVKNAQEHISATPIQTEITISLFSINYTAHRILQRKTISLRRSSPIWHYWFIQQRIWIWYWSVKKTIFKQLKLFRKPSFPLDGCATQSCRDDQKNQGCSIMPYHFVLPTLLGFMMPKMPQSQITFLKLQNNLHQQVRIQPTYSAASVILAQTPDLSVAVLQLSIPFRFVLFCPGCWNWEFLFRQDEQCFFSVFYFRATWRMGCA